ncbi:hypothetical protein M3221_00405 [Domibacillus indicus]|nr:hypothetical protein [Domibacillus indicus]MCM3786891.1 hypothetical protein [Domibacillus indicus]
MERNEGRAANLAAYIAALAQIERNGNVYVSREIAEAIAAIKVELELKK